MKKKAKGAGASAVDKEIANGNRAPAVSRAAAALRLLAGERAGLGVTEIARRIELVPSTCLHVLRALVDEGLIAFDPQTKTYSTGVGLMTLVREAMALREFPRLVQPVLDRLAADHQVSAVAVELDSRERLVVVAASRSSGMVSLHINVGSRFPALISATGRCVAAMRDLSRDELKKKFEALNWEKAPRFEDWCAEIERAKIEKVAVDRGGYIRGVTVVAALLPRGADRATRGIALIGFDHHMATERTMRLIKDDLRASVENLAAQFH